MRHARLPAPRTHRPARAFLHAAAITCLGVLLIIAGITIQLLLIAHIITETP